MKTQTFVTSRSDVRGRKLRTGVETDASEYPTGYICDGVIVMGDNAPCTIDMALHKSMKKALRRGVFAILDEVCEVIYVDSCTRFDRMNERSIKLAEGLVGTTYVQQAVDARRARESRIRILLEQVIFAPLCPSNTVCVDRKSCRRRDGMTLESS